MSCNVGVHVWPLDALNVKGMDILPRCAEGNRDVAGVQGSTLMENVGITHS